MFIKDMLESGEDIPVEMMEVSDALMVTLTV